ncbi:hypothetical protein EOL70_02115 [Leucothrix sargassi]|nr:hypothetical protein EOL70_02115 [Leucothrix sargassi]
MMKVFCASALLMMSSIASATENSHLQNFTNIFDRYCYAFKGDHSSSGVLLEKDGHNRNPTFQDAYEILIGSIDYAVTPQQYDCTTDVLVKHKGQLLFTHDALNKHLVKAFNLIEVSTSSFEDVALNNQNTLIRQTDYKGPAGNNYRLLFPLDNQASYYMTFTIDW